MAKWDATEAAFETKNGYRRLVNSMLEGSYAQAQSGWFGAANLTSKQDATDFAAQYLYNFQGMLNDINRSGAGDVTVGGAFSEVIPAQPDAAATKVYEAKAKDYLDSRRMTLFTEAAYVAKSLGITTPLYSVQDGQLRLNAMDIEYDGKPIIRITQDGSVSKLNEQGEAVTLDRWV